MAWTVQELRDRGVSEALLELRRWRAMRRITGRRFAAECRVHRSDLTAIETGKHRLTRAVGERIYAAAQRLGVQAGELCAFEAELSSLGGGTP